MIARGVSSPSRIITATVSFAGMLDHPQIPLAPPRSSGDLPKKSFGPKGIAILSAPPSDLHNPVGYEYVNKSNSNGYTIIYTLKNRIFRASACSLTLF